MDAIRKRNGHHTKSKSTPINATHTTGGIRSANRKTPTMPGKQQCPYRFKQILKGFIVMCLLLLLLRYVVMRYELELNSNVAFSSLKSSSGDKKYDKSNVGTSRDDDDPKAAASSIKIGVYPFVEVMTVNTETKDNSVTNEIEEDPFDSSKMIFYPIFDIQEHILQSFDEEIYKSKSIIQKIYNKKRMKFLSKQKATKNSKWKIRRQNHKNNKNDIFVDPQVMERYYNNTVMIMTRKSYKGGSVQDQINQDRAMVVLNPFLNSNDGMMIGIFDGHAQEGHIVAHVIQQTLPKILVQQLSPILFENSTIATTKNNTTTRNNEQLKRAITKSFTIADTNIPLEYGINAGCTTSLILQIDSYTIITANVGDSQSFIFQYNKSTKSTKIVYITRKHKPDDPIERKRIEGMGGKVSIPPVKEQIMNGQRIEISSRVEIPKTNIGPVSLAMSRSMGDHDGRNVGVISEPTVNILNIEELKATTKGAKRDAEDSKLEEIELYAVAASDGVLDFIKPIEIAEKLAKTFSTSSHEDDKPKYRGMFNDHYTLMNACEDLILQASASWSKTGMKYRDDITIAVSKIQG